jgi:hypothetical protein
MKIPNACDLWFRSSQNSPTSLPAEGWLRTSQKDVFRLLPSWPALHMCHLFGVRSLVTWLDLAWLDLRKSWRDASHILDNLFTSNFRCMVAQMQRHQIQRQCPFQNPGEFTLMQILHIQTQSGIGRL